MQDSNINEGLEHSDLKRLVHPELHIDAYKSKMGRDEDIVVVSFKITGREPAEDLVNFISLSILFYIITKVFHSLNFLIR